VSRDGHLLYPAFPYTSFTRISRADADDLYAFLKTVPASKQPSQSHRLRWPYSAQFALRVWRSLFFTPADAPTQASSPAADAAHGSAWLRGQYLVQGLGHCQECHGARNALGALSQTPQAAGSVLPGALWLAPSLYNPQGASPANWSAAQTVDFLRSGRNSTAIASGPMAEVVLHSTQYLSDADAQAVAQYLRTLPQQSAPSAALVQPPAGMLQKGAKLYEKHCADCHGAEGQGQAGAYPALAGNRQVTQASPNNLINTVLNGGFGPATQGQPRPFGMPPFMLQLKDAEIADVLSYVRNSWGNQAAALSEFDINKFRRKQAP
jgi:mono/diheme cytochrome c family protein